MRVEPTDAAVLFRMVYQAMRRAKLPLEAILAQAGIAVEHTHQLTRTPVAAHHAFWQAAEEITGDSDIGLHLGEHLPLYRGQVIEHLFLSSATFGDGLKRALAYYRLLSDSFQGELRIQQEQAQLVLIPVSGEHFERHTLEAFVVGMNQFFNFLMEGQFRLTCIDFAYAQGATQTEYRRVLGCDVRLGQPEHCLYFDRALLMLPLWQAEPDLLRLNEQLAQAKIQELDRLDLVNEVRRAIGESLEGYEVTLNQIAQRLNMPARRLRSQLAEAGTSFQQILTDYRCRLAKRLLKDTDERIEKIAYLTGFSEPSTFYRAFKRWTQETPLGYRRRRQTQNTISNE